MARLKMETASRHAAIERVVPLLDPRFDRVGYRAYLSAMYAFHEPIEDVLAALPRMREVLPDFDERRKLPLLARDLAALGATRPTASVPRSQLPRVDSTARAFGVLYVLEGSTLGGRVISRHLESGLGIAPASGGAYLASYGDALSSMWRRFGAAVERFDVGGDGSAVVEAAKETFEKLTAWLTEALDAHA